MDIAKRLKNARISKNMSENAGECFEISHILADSNQIQGESIERLNSGLAQMNNSIDDIAGAVKEKSNALPAVLQVQRNHQPLLLLGLKPTKI